MLVEWGQQTDVPPRTGVALVHDETVEEPLQTGTAFESLA
jgi:hypothetical protein